MSRLNWVLLFAAIVAAIYFLVPIGVNMFLRANPSVFIDDEVEVSLQTEIECLTFTSDRDMTVSIASSDDISLLVYKPWSLDDPDLMAAHQDFLNCAGNPLGCRMRTDWPEAEAEEMAVLGGFHPSIRNQSFQFEVDEDEPVCVMLFNQALGTVTASRLVETTPR